MCRIVARARRLNSPATHLCVKACSLHRLVFIEYCTSASSSSKCSPHSCAYVRLVMCVCRALRVGMVWVPSTVLWCDTTHRARMHVMGTGVQTDRTIDCCTACGSRCVWSIASTQWEDVGRCSNMQVYSGLHDYGGGGPIFDSGMWLASLPLPCITAGNSCGCGAMETTYQLVCPRSDP